jgi:hypothetical protein
MLAKWTIILIKRQNTICLYSPRCQGKYILYIYIYVAPNYASKGSFKYARFRTLSLAKREQYLPRFLVNNINSMPVCLQGINGTKVGTYCYFLNCKPGLCQQNITVYSFKLLLPLLEFLLVNLCLTSKTYIQTFCLSKSYSR